MSFDREKEAMEPKPFGVHYVPYVKRKPGNPGEFAFACKVEDIPVSRAISIDFTKVKIAVYNMDGVFYAIKDACPHAEYPLAKGTLRGEIVSCSSHNWQFSVKTGKCIRADHEVDISNLAIRTFPVEMRGDEIWVKV